MNTWKYLAIFIALSLSNEAQKFLAGTSFPPIVFVSRNRLPNADYDLPGMGPQFRTTLVGGKLMLRKANGVLLTLVDSTELIDVADPCVSWDGKKILFSGIQHADSNWRIFEIGVDGSAFRQITFSDRNISLNQFGAAKILFITYDDFDPCYLPEGKIAFASTRYPSMAMAAQVRTSNLYVMNADGGEMHRITSERSGAEEPTIDPVTGQIVYARWWVNIDMPSNDTRTGLTREPHSALTDDIGNIWQAIVIRPDGTELKLYAGFARTRYGLQTYKPAILRDGKLLSVFSPRTSLAPTMGGYGIRWFKRGADLEHYVAGLKSDETLRKTSAGNPPFATDPVELAPDRILLSYSKDGDDYGIYSCTMNGRDLRKIVDLTSTLELEPQVVSARPLPPIVKEQVFSPVSDLPPTEDPETYGRNDYFRFDCMNIFSNGKVDEPMPDAPQIAQDLSIQFFMNAQRQNSLGADPSILLKSAAVLYNGGIHEPEIPAEVPLFEQIIDKDNGILRTPDGRFAHVAGMNFDRRGAGTKCVGCHIGHSMIEVPKNGALAEWFNAAPSAEIIASSEFRDAKGIVYAGRNVIDRQARVGGDSVIWIANDDGQASVELRWHVPIEAKQFVLYNISPSADKKISVQSCRIILYYKGIEVGTIPVAGALSANGSTISIPPTKLDAARITITKFSGMIHHRRRAGLAEVETMARLFPKTEI